MPDLSRPAAVLLALVLTAVTAGPAFAAFPDDPPDDSLFDASEETFPACTTPVTDQQYQLFSVLPSCSPLATDPEGASGNSVDSAWRDFSIGTPEVLIAYVEGGINWHDSEIADIADKVHLNRGELADCMDGFTDNGDPWFSAADFPGTADANDNGIIDAEDMIAVCSDDVDDDGNGYVDDISGWNTYDGDNDPGTPDTAYLHANNQMQAAAAITDNGFAEAGICPLCTLLPVKAGAEALDRTDDLAEAWR